MKVVIFILFCFALTIHSQNNIKGKITKVTDGDTVILLDSTNTQHKIRLHGIDAPENGQDYGNKSKQYLSSLIAGKKVKVDVKGTDQYKRILGVIYLDDMNINAEMIRAGYAWNYYYSKDRYYISLQKKAQEQKLGLWSIPNPIDPYYYRKNKRKK